MLTPTAATAMIDARDEVGVPSDWGIRFFVPPDGSTGITFDFVAAPEPDDVLGGSGKLRTYVEAAIHREIGDATVDFEFFARSTAILSYLSGARTRIGYHAWFGEISPKCRCGDSIEVPGIAGRSRCSA